MLLTLVTATLPVLILQYGGNPVSMAIAEATLCVIEDEHLQEHAAEVGGFMLSELQALKTKHPQVIGDVRWVCEVQLQQPIAPVYIRNTNVQAWIGGCMKEAMLVQAIHAICREHPGVGH